MWFLRFNQALAILFMPWLLSLLIQSLGRLFLLYTYANNVTIYHADVIKVLIIGLRFDLRTSCILFGALLLLTLFSLFSARITRYWQKTLKYLSIIALLTIAIFTIINTFYYITYDHHIDVFIFGLVDDDTVAVLKTIWSDYPVISGSLIFFIFVYLIVKLMDYWYRWSVEKINFKNTTWLAAPSVFIILVVTFIGCRGGTGTFPLREADAQVSQILTLNEFVPNGLIAFNWAYSGYKLDNQFKKIPVEESQQAINLFFGEEKACSLQIFASKTAINPISEKKPPNVIFTVMESMGSHLFEFDNPQRDLLGSLRTHWSNDWLFSRFISEGDGTIDTLSRFFIRSPITTISQSSAQNIPFSSNMFKPFKEKGYKIIYITAGNGAWRNVHQFLLNLGVDEFVEQNTLLHEYPEAKLGTWGVPDEFMFKYAQKRLTQAEQKGEHVMIMMLSITNHPPYHPPTDSPYFNYQITSDELSRFKNMDSETELRNMFNTFRYSNDQLGQFISWIKNQSLGDYTIVAATGDHNLRGIGYTDPKELALGHSVPFYLYVPKAYQYHTIYDSLRVGSHKDIMPTLYQLSLSDTPYYQTGCNLLAEEPNPIWCNVGYNPNVVIDNKGAYSLNNNTFASWENSTGLRLTEANNALSNAQLSTIHRWRNWSKLLHWQLMEQIEGAN